MSENRTENSSSDAEHDRPDWMREAEDALDRIGDAIRVAWEETRDTRLNALGSAKQAAKQLGEALDRGAEAARNRWQASQPEPPTRRDEETPVEPTGAGEEA